MKLTHADRTAFVNAVLDDVPLIDYREQAQKLIIAEFAKQLPPAVKALWDDKELRPYVATHNFGHDLAYVCAPSHPDRKPKLSPAARKAVDDLIDKHHEQDRSRYTLRSKVNALIAACSTLKQAKAALPEFEKYLPQERGSTGVTNLPAVANTVAELTKAGWPKGKK